MDEYDRGMDPEVKRYFRKIVTSFSIGLLWLITIATAGLFFRLGIIKEGIRWYHIVFYLVFLLSLIWVSRFYYRLWRK